MTFLNVCRAPGDGYYYNIITKLCGVTITMGVFRENLPLSRTTRLLKMSISSQIKCGIKVKQHRCDVLSRSAVGWQNPLTFGLGFLPPPQAKWCILQRKDMGVTFRSTNAPRGCGGKNSWSRRLCSIFLFGKTLWDWIDRYFWNFGIFSNFECFLCWSVPHCLRYFHCVSASLII